ncbi:MAG: Uma2 family endonuclease [Candidatus Eremiobacteraeota bacterium]|nr:Uma2 family endonuclease [Candidatus Eremiobacteraeota bacterium]
MSLSGEDLLQIEGDYELERGELVEMVRPGFEHGRIVTNVGATLRSHVKPNQLGQVVTETGFYLERDPDTVRGPDVAFFSRSRVPADPSKFAESPPDLAVEVVSPHDRSDALEERVRRFLEAGVNECWVLYPRTHTMHRFRLDWSEVLSRGQRVHSVPCLPGFECLLAEFFDE